MAALTITAYQGDAGGSTVGRQPNEIYLVVTYAPTGHPVVDLQPWGVSSVTVAAMTPGIVGNVLVTAVQKHVLDGAYIVQFQPDASLLPGIHVFAVGITLGNPPTDVGFTLTTAIVAPP